jgi:hypothetical protein
MMLVAMAVASAGLFGCTAEVAPAVSVPGDYYDYPYTYYDGHIVYFVHGNWYYPYGNRWYYYRRVPPGLAQRSDSLHYYRATPRVATPRATPYVRPYGRGGGPPPAVRRR